MSLNQSRVEKNESHFRKTGRSGSSGNQRNFSGGGGKGGGGSAPPQPSSLNNSSTSSSTNRSSKKSGNGHGVQSRVNTTSANSEPNVQPARVSQNGAHVQPILHGASDAPVSGASAKPTNAPAPRSNRAVPKAPSSQTTAGASDSPAPATPAKGDASNAFSFQFGTISPGFINGMQIPARTSSAPPNLDEQKRDQARHDSSGAAPALPIPSVPKQQQPRKDLGKVNQSNTGESPLLTQAKRDIHAQGLAAPGTTTIQKPSVLPGTGMAMPFQQPQVPVPFGPPNPQIQSQGVTATSLQMPMPLSLGNSNQMQQQVFVPSLQSHPLQPQGMIHQGQSLSFAPQIGHQLAPQLSNMTMGMAPPFAQQQAGKFGGPRKAVKITHPETHEELRLDKRTDSYMDGGSSGTRSHPTVNPQSQPIPSFTPTHQISYYSHMPTSTYNPNNIFFQSQTSLPLTSTQMTTSSPASRYNYPVSQGPPTISFMNPSALNPSPVNKTGLPMHMEPSNPGHTHDVHALSGSAPSASVEVTVKPAVGSRGEKLGSSSVTVSSPLVSKGESPKLLRPLREAAMLNPQRDSGIASEISVQQSKSVSEPMSSIPPSVTVKNPPTASITVSVPKLPSSASSSAAAVPHDESASVVTNAEGRRRESVRRSDSFKDHQKKLIRKDLRDVQSQHQENATDSVGSSKSFSSVVSGEITKHPENLHGLPVEVVESSTSSSPSISGCLLESIDKPSPANCVGPDASEVVNDGVRTEGTTSEPLSTCDLDHAEQDDHTLQEVQLEQEISVTVEQVEAKPSELLRGSSNSLPEGNGQKEESSVKETIVGSESGSMEAEQVMDESVACSPQVDRMTDNLVRSDNTASDSNDAVTAASSSVSRTLSSDNAMPTVDSNTIRNERTDSQDVSITESGISHPDLASVPAPMSSEVNSELESKISESTSSGSISTSVSGSKDKPELNRVKSAAGKLKKRRKDILKAADAAGSTSDLYMAYKGPEEKQETAISSGSIDSSYNTDLKHTPADGAEKDVLVSEEESQNKAEPDDWEDAADISTPKLKTSDDGKEGGLMHGDGDGDGVTSRKYTRDFLLTFSEQCTDLPVNFDIGPDIAAETLMSVPIAISHHVDRESYPNSGRIIDRPGGGPRPDRRGSGMLDDDKWSKSPGPFAGRDPRLEMIGHGGGAVVGFRPGQGGNHGVLRNPRGHPSGQYVGGILSGPMHSMGSQGGIQRNSSDADRWQRATGLQKGLIPSPQTPLQIMHKAERKYEVGKVSDKEQAKQRQLKAILNKLTPQNFEKLFEQVKEVNIDNTVTLSGVISQIFDKALMEPTFCEMYADFCFHLSSELPDFSEDNEKITFKRLLLNKCQEEFERGEREQAEADRVEEEGEIKRSEEEREEKRVQARRRMLGNIRLIGELYKKKMLTERIMHECITKLLGQYQNPDEEDIEALCKLMSTIGEMIDHPKAKEHIDVYFDRMLKLSNNMKLSSRVRFMLKDAIDLRKNEWRVRRKVEGPKKIEEVHRDAAQERQAQTSRLARGPSIGGGSARRGPPMDFGPRGSNVLSSPNSQISSLRGLPTQVRGYGGQDARLEDRHSYESRTLSVPLSQRPIDDDSITLGPQGGLARGMSIRGQPLIASVPLVDMSPNPLDSRRFAAGPNGYSSMSERTPYEPREELAPRYFPERFTGMPAYDQLISHERHTFLGNRDLRSVDRYSDRPLAPATRVQGSSTVSQGAVSEKVWPEERLRDMSIAAIREFYSAKDEGEVALCVKELNSPGFYPSMISIWVTDSFERKDLERDLLAKLLVNLNKSHDSLLTEGQLIKGFESVFATLEDTVNDAPKAAEFLGRILSKAIMENVVSLREIGRLIQEGGEEPGRLLELGLAAEVLGTILESVKLEKGESVLNEIRTSSKLRLEDFRALASTKSKKLEAFI
ncbi:MIF4G-like [Macleaya cordata]|uniref:Eukaryotic translation initiation factor 4G n=1 Tax=Macleaya cordata TaxID=56857 RepID=A0A200QQH1_MACCD|nr:MIF4G-like [Macleaya cordata]